MQFASRSCALYRVLYSSLFLFIFTAAFCGTAAAAPDYYQISHQAVTMLRKGNLTGATSLLEGSLPAVENGNDPQWEATMLGLLGAIYERTGQFTEAEDALNRSVSGWTRLRGPDTPTLVDPLCNLGELYAKAGQYSRAEKFLSRSLSINRVYGTQPDLRTRLLINLGNVYFEEHKLAEAEETAHEALNDFLSVKQPAPDTSAVFSLLGSICYRSGRIDEAESWLQQALKFRESNLPPNDPLIAASAANLAVFYAHSDQPDKARSLFERAASVFDNTAAPDNFVLNFYRHYAEFDRKTGHRKEARQLAKSVEKMWTHSAENALSTQIVDVKSLQSLR
jgi:Flp pilus assembly protein TadD